MILIKNANLLDVESGKYKITDILTNGKIILKIGNLLKEDYPDAILIEANKKLVTPGLVDAHCHVGMIESTIGWAGSDVNEFSNPITPELRGIDAIKPHDPCFKNALDAGITTVCTGPGSANIIGGTFCALKTKGKTVNDMVVKEEIAMKMALGENPKRCYGNSQKCPITRMASAALMREWLFKAKEYYEKKLHYQQDIKDKKENIAPIPFDMKLESLSRVFSGMKVKIHAHQADDIFTAMRIIKEFNLDATIEHCTEGYLIADTLKEYHQNCIIGPTLGEKSKYELKSKSFEAAKILKKHDITFAIMTDHPVVPLENTLTQAGLFVKAGLSFEDTFKALTINPAKLVGLDNKIGSIKEGKDADIIIWSGDPFHYMTHTDVVILNGNIEKNTL